MPVSQGHLLLGRQPVKPSVALAGCSLPVLPLAVKDSEDGQSYNSELANKVDCVPGVVLGGVLLDVGPSAWSCQLPFARNTS
jgi:hypothetical protein